MIKIRKSVFETNSSSAHTLTLDKSGFKKIVDNKEFDIVVGVGEYGWGIEELDNWYEKADYFGVECGVAEWNKNRDVPKSVLKRKKYKRELLIKVIRRKFPNGTIIFDNTGYIDHQSRGEIWEKVLDSKNDEKMLYNIIFGNSKILIDNDNY